MRRVHVPHEVEDDKGCAASINFRIGVPGVWCVFPCARSKDGMTKKEVARATDSSLTHEHLSRVVDRAQGFVDEKGLSLIWIPPHMLSLQPIELF